MKNRISPIVDVVTVGIENGFSPSSVIRILQTMRDDKGIYLRFENRVLQIQQREGTINGKIITRENIKAVTDRLHQDWRDALNEKIFRIMNEHL